jgi:uncharacterized protein (TIGR02596 family)
MSFGPKKISSAPAFSLIEMLLVVTIVASLFAIAAQGLKKTWEGQELKASAMKLANDISLASQTAVKLNKPVQLRFYKFEDNLLASEQNQFRAYQLVVAAVLPTQSGATIQWRPLYELQKLEGNTVMSSNQRFSTLLQNPQKPNPSEVDGRLQTLYSAGLGQSGVEMTSVEFRPDGTTNLDPAANVPWCITFVPVRYAAESVLPADFQTLTIAPETGAVRIY